MIQTVMEYAYLFQGIIGMVDRLLPLNSLMVQ